MALDLVLEPGEQISAEISFGPRPVRKLVLTNRAAYWTDSKSLGFSITNDWPCFGIPSKMVCDRGSDLTSKDLENAAFQLGIELDFTPPRTPNVQ